MYIPERLQEVLGQAVVLSAVRKPRDGDDIGLKPVFNLFAVHSRMFVKVQTTLEEDEISGSLEHRRPRYNILSGRSYGNGEHHRVANHTSWDNWWIEEH